MVLDEFLKCVVGCKSYAMAIFLQLVPEGDEWLYITSTADDLDDDVEPDGPRWNFLVFCRLPFRVIGGFGINLDNVLATLELRSISVRPSSGIC